MKLANGLVSSLTTSVSISLYSALSSFIIIYPSSMYTVKLVSLMNLTNRFHHGYNAKIRLGQKIQLKRLRERTTMGRDTQQSEAPNQVCR